MRKSVPLTALSLFILAYPLMGSAPAEFKATAERPAPALPHPAALTNPLLAHHEAARATPMGLTCSD
ncbi:hypothetical protein [Streptomyces boninensis]|uniref:hypothetical protein n=1 Tax=Streptomyces boninensis TaxID=2039455 RepID=UPI003B20FF4B